MPRKFKQKSFVWKAFTKVSETKVKCNKCSNIYKHFGTTNLIKHLKRKHRTLYLQLSGKRCISEVKVEPPRTVSNSLSHIDSSDESGQSKNYKMSRWRQKSNFEYLHCRVCLTKTRNYRSIFEPFESADLPPNEMLKLITGVVVDETGDKSLPRVICKACELSLNMAYNFRLQAIKSEQVISNYRNRNYMNNIVIALDNGKKYKLSKDLTLKVVKKMNEDAGDDTLDEDSSNIMKLEGNDPLNVKYESSDQMYQITEVPEFSVQVEIDPSTGENYENCIIKESPDFTKEFEEESDYWPEDDEDIFSYKLNKLQPDTNSNEDKSVDEPRSYICEVCGANYKTRPSLAVHLKRHANEEKPYSCDVCHKGFYLKAGLTRHRMVHAVEKPFKCRLCYRRFYNTSSRKYHELVHTGIRPYVCKVCNKDFLYSWALNKHFMTHNIVKLHECECCGLSFRLPQHLKQHNESLKHKTNFANWNKLE